MISLAEKVKSQIRPSFKEKMKYSSIEEVPKINKIVVSSGIGKIKEDQKKIDYVVESLSKITGQKPKINRSKSAVSAYKLRIGQPVGVSVTLRGQRMYAFLNKLINVALPRSKDFRGLNKSGFDGHGNYSMGIIEQTIMPDVKHDETKESFGFQININLNTDSDELGYRYLKKLGLPLKS